MNEEEMRAFMSHSDRQTSGFKAEDYIVVEDLDQLVRFFFENRRKAEKPGSDIAVPHTMKKKMEELIRLGIFGEKYLAFCPEYSTEEEQEEAKISHLAKIKTFLANNWKEELNIKLYFSPLKDKKTKKVIEERYWLKFKDETYQPDPSKANPKAMKGLKKWQKEQKKAKTQEGK